MSWCAFVCDQSTLINHEVLKDGEANQKLVPLGIAHLAGPIFDPSPFYVVPPSFVVALPFSVFVLPSSFAALKVVFSAPPSVVIALPLTYIVVHSFFVEFSSLLVESSLVLKFVSEDTQYCRIILDLIRYPKQYLAFCKVVLLRRSYQ